MIKLHLDNQKTKSFLIHYENYVFTLSLKGHKKGSKLDILHLL